MGIINPLTGINKQKANEFLKDKGIKQGPKKDIIMERASVTPKPKQNKSQPSKTMSKQEFLQETYEGKQTMESNLTQAQSQLNRLEMEKKTIGPTGKYTSSLYPDRKFVYGSEIIRSYNTAISDTKKNISDIKSGIGVYQKTYIDIQNMPKDIKVKKTGNEYKIIRPDTSLDFAKQEIKKGENLPPVIKELYYLGYGVASTGASVIKPVADAFSSSSRVGFSGTRITTMPTFKKRDTHFISPIDYVFEPIGLSPKGSSALVSKAGPAFIAGGLAMEVGVSWAVGKAIKPIGMAGKAVGGKIASTKTYNVLSKGVKSGYSSLTKNIYSTVGRTPKFVQSGFNKFFGKYQYDITNAMRAGIIKNPSRIGGRGGVFTQLVAESGKYNSKYGLIKGTYLSPYTLTGVPSTKLSLTVAGHKFNDRIGIAKAININSSGIYKIVKLSKNRGTWAAGPSANKMLSKGTIGGMLVYDPFNKSLGYTGKKSIIDRLSSRSVRMSQKNMGVFYSYVDDVSSVVSKTKLKPVKFWDLADEGVKLPDKYFIKGPSGGKYVPETVSGQLGGTGRMSTVSIVKNQPLYKGVNLADDVAKVSFHTGGFPERINLTRGEINLLKFLDKAQPPYQNISRIMPSGMANRFPKIVTTPNVYTDVGRISGFKSSMSSVGGKSFVNIQFKGVFTDRARPISFKSETQSIGGLGLINASNLNLNSSSIVNTGLGSFNASFQKIKPAVDEVTITKPKLTNESFEDFITYNRLKSPPLLFPVGKSLSSRGAGSWGGSLFGKKYKFRKFNVGELKI